jgi:hypothetical protein
MTHLTISCFGLTAGLVVLGSPPTLGANVPTVLDRPPTLITPFSVDADQDDTARAPAPGPSGNPLWAVPLSSLTATRERPLFLPSRRQPMPVVAGPPPTPVQPRPAAPPAEPERPQLSLVGTIASATDGIGVFIDDATRDVVRIKTGEGYAGWVLRSVSGREVTFENGRRSATLSLPAPGMLQAGQGAVPTPAAAQAADNTWVDGDGRIIALPKQLP